MKSGKLFNNGRSQAVRLPKEFRFEGTEVYVKRLGNAVVLIPIADPWANLRMSLTMFPDDFMKDGREQIPLKEREDF
jgi:antitoxin VapB